ncbi:MAG: FtsX-like permease family protein [Lachnospiraceae bacterium]|nr:FtsX-like permease family protein [Lachnospiraceae bacterium]
MKKAQWTDLFREIRKSRGRYLSLLFIVALGTAFYAGVRSAEPDMTSSADRYYDETDFMDVRVLGTLGLTEEDLKAVDEVSGISGAEGTYSAELFAICRDAQPVMNVLSACESMNRMTLEEGRMPERSDECFMDAGFMLKQGYQLGDTVTLTDENGKSPENMVTDTYTIVGSGTWSWYLSWSRGAASIGDGSLDAFMVVLPEAFDQDYYNVIYARVEQTKALNTFSQEYDDAVELVTDRLEEIADGRCEIRYAQVYNEAEKELDDAGKDVSSAKKELADAEKKLTDGEAEYEEGRVSYQDGMKKYQDGVFAYQKGEKKLADSRAQLDDGRAEYQAGKKKLAEAEKKAAESRKQLLTGRKQLEAAKKDLSAGKKQLKEQKKQLDQNSVQVAEGLAACEKGASQISAAKKELSEKEKELEAGEAAYQAGLKRYEEGASQLAEAKKQLDAAQQQITEAQAQLDELYAQAEQVKETSGEDSAVYQRLYAQWTEGSEKLAQQKQLLQEKQAQYDASAAELASSKKTLDQTAAKLSSGRKQLEAGKKQLNEKEKELKAQKAKLVQAQKQIKSGYAAVSAAEKEIESGQKTLTEKEKELKTGEKQLAAGEKTISESKKQLSEAGQKLEKGEKAYQSGLKELKASEKELADAKKDLKKAKKKLADARSELDDGWEKYRKEEKKAKPKLKDAEAKIADGEAELAKLEKAKWYVLDRDSVQTSVEYGMDAERIGAIGKVFPAIFFLVAALVSLTTMTRMIEEERTLIGTMKALGYGKLSIASKYILYALSATLTGGIFGVLAGSRLLPFVIMTAYGMLYSNVPYMLMPLHMDLCLGSIGLAVLCTVGAAFAACYKELLSTPASLMRPPSPKQGKRVIFERLPFIWKRLNFSMKSTIRNLLRYKKRFFMTVFGIGGCMSLLLVSFGLHDSIAEIVNNQYKNIWMYSGSCGLDEKIPLTEQQAFAERISREQPEIESSMLARNASVDASAAAAEKTVYLYVVQDVEQVKAYLDLHDRTTKEAYELSDEGVIITEKLSNILGVKAGDTITLKLSDTKQKTVKITAVAENYLHHYIYLTPGLYKQLYGEEPEYNELFLKFAKGTDDKRERQLAEYLLNQEPVTSVSLVDELQATVDDMMNALNLVVWVLVISAGLLVFVVLYNLNNINISERRRELASLKVLGFYDMEVALYVYRENVFLTIFGIIAGIFMGTWLHRYMILTLEVDMIMFGRNISPASYLYSILFTAAFAVLVNLSMYYKLRNINMVESLKSVE